MEKRTDFTASVHTRVDGKGYVYGSLVIVPSDDQKSHIMFHPYSFTSEVEEYDFCPRDEHKDRRVRAENVLANVLGVVSQDLGIDRLTALQVIMNSGKEGIRVENKNGVDVFRKCNNMGGGLKRKTMFKGDISVFKEMIKISEEEQKAKALILNWLIVVGSSRENEWRGILR